MAPLDLSHPPELSLALLPDIVLIIGAMGVLLGTVRHRDAPPGASRATSIGAVIVCLATLATIIWCAVAVWPYFKWVALAQGPYFVWVSLATVLQLSITWMNWGRS